MAVVLPVPALLVAHDICVQTIMHIFPVHSIQGLMESLLLLYRMLLCGIDVRPQYCVVWYNVIHLYLKWKQSMTEILPTMHNRAEGGGGVQEIEVPRRQTGTWKVEAECKKKALAAEAEAQAKATKQHYLHPAEGGTTTIEAWLEKVGFTMGPVTLSFGLRCYTPGST